MIGRSGRTALALLGVCAAMMAARGTVEMPVADAQGPAARVFELRTYTAQPGRFEAMQTRFRQQIIPLFKKHGMTLVGFWTAADAPNSENTLVYILAHDSREAAKKSWDAFRKDPGWVKARADSEAQAGGSLTTKVESVFLSPTDFSPMK